MIVSHVFVNVCVSVISVDRDYTGPVELKICYYVWVGTTRKGSNRSSLIYLPGVQLLFIKVVV